MAAAEGPYGLNKLAPVPLSGVILSSRDIPRLGVHQVCFFHHLPSRLMSSAVEVDLPTSPRLPLAPFPPLPPLTTGGGRPQEFYGFVAWITTYIAFAFYLLWAFLPDKWIQGTGLQWYPNR